MSKSVVMVGGGVLGMLGACRLAEQGCRVTLLDRHEVGREASWAGGGIVSPLYPWRYAPAVTALAHWSQDYYPRLAEGLLASTGIDPEVHVTGLYWLDLEDEAGALAWAVREGRPLARVGVAEVRRAVPPLGGGFASAIHLPGVANVRNPRLLQALRAELLRLGVTLREHCEVLSLLQDDSRIRGVRTAQGDVAADEVVIAAGAWSGRLLATLGLALPVRPMKGQMLLFRCARDFLPSMVLAGGRYAIPRRDGHVLVGSTLEDVGFDKVPTDDALASLRASAEQLLPALAEVPVVAHWAGLRPGSPDGVPFIGPVPGHEGLWLNGGHFRNGLVLAPASCELLAALMTGARPPVDPAPYRPGARLGAAG